MEGVRAVVLVEGASDQAAVETLARRRGRDLDTEGVMVVPMGGATNMRTFAERFGPRGLAIGLAGLYDAGEERAVRRGLEAAGVTVPPGGAGLAAVGFHRCDADLEDELIRALGVAEVERVVAAQGELRSLRILQNQPAQRGRSHAAQLRRFIGVRSGRKLRYARLLVEALDLAQVPRPLDCVLAAVG
jgi:Overcoming lysogenization defect protein-like, TOPRIM domain